MNIIIAFPDCVQKLPTKKAGLTWLIVVRAKPLYSIYELTVSGIVILFLICAFHYMYTCLSTNLLIIQILQTIRVQPNSYQTRNNISIATLLLSTHCKLKI